MRALKALVIIMGIMLVGGTGILVAVIIHRAGHRLAQGTMPAAPPSLPCCASVTLPPGAKIEDMTNVGGRLALRVTGPAGEAILLLDPATGAIDQTIAILEPTAEPNP